MGVRTVINGGVVITMNAHRAVHPAGHVIVRGGAIERVGAGPAEPAPGDTVVDATGCAVLPGFVNTHHHLAATLLRGVAGDAPITISRGESLTTRLYRAQGEEESHAGALLAAVELTRSGVTTTTDSQTAWRGLGKNDGSLRAARESGLRVVFSPAFVNRTEMVPTEHHFTVEEAVGEYERLHTAWSRGLVTVIPEVLSLPRGTDELVVALHRAGNGRFAMHLTYSREFDRWAYAEFGHSTIEHLDRLGVLGEGFLGAHPIYLSDQEVAILGERGAAGAYCAVSNMLIGVDHLRLDRLRRSGVRMGLGLDTPNHGHNFFETTKISLLAQKQLAADAGLGDAGEALAWATIGGAEALGLDHEIGSLEPAKRADLQVVDLRRAATAPSAAALSLLVYCGGPEAVRDVMADGRWLLRAGGLVHLDEESVLAHAEAMQVRLLDTAGVPRGLLLPPGWRVD